MQSSRAIACAMPIAFLAAPVQSAAAAQVEWNYGNDANGQDEWGHLSADFASCFSGITQSPVNVTYTKVEKLPPLHVEYSESTIIRQSNGLSLPPTGLSLAVSGKHALFVGADTYLLSEIRFHTPSEHAIRNHTYPLEMQLVHHDARGKTLIVAIFAGIGPANAGLQSVLSDAGSLNLKNLLPETRGYYRYDGSLTTPPCTEPIPWLLFKHPITLSLEQLSAISRLTGQNARHMQPIYTRVIRETVE